MKAPNLRKGQRVGLSPPRRLLLWFGAYLKTRALPYFRHLEISPRAFWEFSQNKRKEWTPAINSRDSALPQSSLSDSSSYLGVCAMASRDSRIFARFKSAKPYKAILEHTGLHDGLRYHSILKERGLEAGKAFLNRHSKIGNPETFSFEGLGKVSPGLLRYMKVATDLDIFFPEWKSRPILEVGIGYGGQLAVMQEVGFSAPYIGVDLLEPLDLAHEYLRESGVDLKEVSFVDGRKLSSDDNKNTPYLFISNYAYSELSPEVQEIYFREFIAKSSCGYVTWNDLSEVYLGGMTCDNFADRVRGVILDEIPLTHAGNKLVIWGSQFA